MIECVMTLDYEIYGNGEGSLRELVLEPAERLKGLFREHNARFVVFVEVAELEIIESMQTDKAVDKIKQQIREFRQDGFELGLHLHPQWYNARYENGSWQLDYGEYNLCRLSPGRIDEILDRSIAYLRKILEAPGYNPVSFRAGNWLLQPTGAAARSLAEHGIKIDSSVFKGGLQRQNGLDYRRSRKNGYSWAFSEDVNVPDPQGILLEVPTFTRMVPMWRMFTAKRIGLQQKGPANSQPRKEKLARLKDLVRLFHPMKLDFCRSTAAEMIRLFEQEMEKDRKNPVPYRPIVAIGHTKDLVDLEAVESFLSYLRRAGVPVSTFGDIYAKISGRDERS